MEFLWSILFSLLILLNFCLKNLDCLAIQLAYLDLSLITLFIIFTFFFWTNINLKNFMAPFYGWASTDSRLEPLEEAVYFLPLSSQMSMYFVYGLKNIKVFFIRINSNKFTIEFFSVAFCLSVSWWISWSLSLFSSTSIASL